MGRPILPDSISKTGVVINVLVRKEHKQMLKELARKEDCSMNRIVRRLIEREYQQITPS